MDRKLSVFVFLTGLLVLSLFVRVETRSAFVEKDNFSSSDGNGLGSNVTVDIPLWQEWNLISFPILPTNNSVVSVFSNVTGFKYLYWYNASEPDPLLRWKIWDDTIPPEYYDIDNTLKRIEPTQGYWLWVDYNQTWYEELA